LRYAYVPGLADRKLVADLEKTMTVEKAVVAGWSRIEGCRTDRERATFAEALARKRGCFAFPNEFNNGLSRFKDRLKRAKGKKSHAGDLLAALGEIRVQASPAWGAANVSVFFWFLAEQEKIADFNAARDIVQNWMSTIRWPERFALAGNTRPVTHWITTISLRSGQSLQEQRSVELSLCLVYWWAMMLRLSVECSLQRRGGGIEGRLAGHLGRKPGIAFDQFRGFAALRDELGDRMHLHSCAAEQRMASENRARRQYQRASCSFSVMARLLRPDGYTWKA